MPQSTYGPLGYPAEPWLPIRAPNYWFDTRQPPYQPFVRQPIPEGETVGWWRQPDKSTWPYQPVPWGYKASGVFPPRKVKMRENIGAPVNDGPSKPWPSPDIWPTVKYPQPAGLAHVNTRPDGWRGVNKSVHTIKVRMLPDVWLEVTPHPSVWAEAKLEEALRQMTRKRPLKLQTEDGSITIKAIRHPNWSQAAKARKEYHAAMKARREERNMEMLAQEIVRTKGQPKPHVDLFS